MLTFEEFMDKKRIILAKPLATYIMQRNSKTWTVFEIVNDIDCNDFHCNVYLNESAYIFYKSRMDSYGFKQFSVFAE